MSLQDCKRGVRHYFFFKKALGLMGLKANDLELYNQNRNVAGILVQ